MPSKSNVFRVERGNTLVDIGAYCLMGNHLHLLLHEKNQNGISAFMQKLTTAYVMYFNRKHERTGAFFEGTYKAKHLDEDDYLKYIFSYIHLNPVEHIEPEWKELGIKNMKKVKAYLASYIHSSYLDYTGREREEHAILNESAFPEYFIGKNSFRSFTKSWLALKSWGDDNDYVSQQRPIEF